MLERFRWEAQDAAVAIEKLKKIGRGERIRTSGPCLPKQVLTEKIPRFCAFMDG